MSSPFRNAAVAASRALVLVLALAPAASADYSDWSDDSGGATRAYSNQAARIRWETYLGDWSDAAGTPQGDVPFSEAVVAREATRVEIDVTALVQRWTSGELRADGMFIRGSGGEATMHSREAADASVRPTLILATDTGEVTLSPEADTGISESTTSALGENTTFRLSRALLRFPRDAFALRTISAATLVLHRVSPSGGAVTARVFACRQPRTVMPVEHGFAADYELDRGIAEHPDVYAAMDFSGDAWTRAGEPLWEGRGGVVIDETDAAEVANGFVPIDGPAARWGFAEGRNGGGGATLAFPEDAQPDEVYSRYYLRLGNNFTPTVDGGKMPGFSFRPGGSPTCNGGSRDTTGTHCWSARGSFGLLPPAANPLAGFVGLGYYVYHPEQEGSYGSGWAWNLGYDGRVTQGRWYAVEEYVRVNSVPGSHDGILRAWVNGRLVFEKTDILFRNTEEIHVGEVWYNIYHGGTAPAPHDMYFWVDNLVVARSYIGPMGGLPDAPPLLEDGTIAPPRTDGGMPADDGGTSGVLDAAASADGGTAARADGGARGDGSSSGDPGLDGGCSCRARGAGATDGGPLVIAAAILAANGARQRRRRRRSAITTAAPV
jgi:hypothetical protein